MPLFHPYYILNADFFLLFIQIFGAYETVDNFALELELMQDEDLFDR